MKTCNGCKYAMWKKTKTGSLCPSGIGTCEYRYKIPSLPKSMYFVASPGIVKSAISRHVEFTDHCVYYEGMDRQKN